MAKNYLSFCIFYQNLYLILINYFQNIYFILFQTIIFQSYSGQNLLQSEQLSSGQQAGYWIASIFLLVLASFCSGNPIQFETIRKEGSEKEQKACNRLRFFMKNRHLTLCSILIVNAACMEILPILLTSLLGEMISLILSVTCIMLFGELIPQIICGTMHWLLWIYVILTFIISKPLALLLDKMLGSNQAHFLQRREIAAFLMQHANDKTVISSSDESDDDADEGKVLYKQEAEQISQLIQLKDLTVDNLDWMVPFDKVYSINSDTIVTKEFLNSLLQVKFSRYPVYKDQRDNIIGTLHIKSLFRMKIGEPLDLSLLNPTLEFKQNVTFFNAFEKFQTGKNHLAIITDKDTNEPIGIVTLEGLLQKLIIDDQELYQ